ncbi:MAG: hypothetical protein AB8F95_18715 [Bacteroidia bacterium]
MDLATLHTQTYTPDFTPKPAEFVSLYEQHQVMIEGTHCGEDRDCMYQKMRFTSDYAHCLFQLEEYSKTAKASQYALGLYESYSDTKSTDLLEQNYYKILLFDQGVAYWHLGKKREAAKNFKRLSSRFPENAIYREWLVSSEQIQLKKIEDKILIILAIVFVFDLFFSDRLPLSGQYILMAFMALSLLGVLAIRIMMFIKKRKKG